MTIQAFINSLPFIINVIVLGTYIVGCSATIFGLYDIHHLKWTGDLKVMITALLTSSIILPICEALKHGTIVSNAMLFTYGFIVASAYFALQLRNPHLSHEQRKQKTLKQLIRSI